LLDVGSGGACRGGSGLRPADLEVTCVDAVAKKAAFVKAVAAELGLRVRGSPRARRATRTGKASRARMPW